MGIDGSLGEVVLDSRGNRGGALPALGAWGDWRARRAWCRGFQHRLVAHGDALCELMRKEVGKPAGEGWSGDLLPLLMSCRWHERWARRVLRDRRVSGGPVLLMGQRHRVVRVPLGHVAVIATWNYPVQLVGIQIVQALMGGNRLTVKPSEQSPGTQGLLLDLAEEGLPSGVLQRVGSDREAGARLLRDEPTGRIDHVVFTGSTGVGRSIAEVLAGRLVGSTLELSGRDSAFVLGDADVGLAARSLLAALRMNHGQTCMAPRRVLVVEGVWDGFVDALRKEMAGLVVEAGRGVQTEAGASRVDGLVEETLVEEGVEVLTGGEGEGCLRVVVGCGVDSALAVEEHFGPAMAVVKVRDEAEALRVHSRVDQHLATMVYSDERGVGERLAPLLGTGTVTVNDALVPQGHPGAPIGGHRGSGWGVSRGEAGLLSMTRGVHVSRTGKRLRVPTDPIEGKKLDQFKTMMRLLYGKGFGIGGGGRSTGSLVVDSGGVNGGSVGREFESASARDGD